MSPGPADASPERRQDADAKYYEEPAPAVSAVNARSMQESEKWFQGSHLRLFYGAFSRDGLTEMVTQGRTSVNSGASRVMGIEAGIRLIRGFIWAPVDLSLDFAILDYDERFSRGSYLGYRLLPKMYWNIPLKSAPRFIFGTGPSYSAGMSRDETWSITKRDGQVRTSRWLNAVFLGLDMNVGRTFGVQRLANCHFGIGDEHRSGLFGVFNGIVGGAEYKSLYAEMEF